MATVKLLDKRTGNTYVYDSHSYWDKEAKKYKKKRTLIGKIDPETGAMIPTDGRGKNRDPSMPKTLMECRAEIRKLRAEIAELKAKYGEN